MNNIFITRLLKLKIMKIIFSKGVTMKKKIALLLLVVSLGILSACGKKRNCLQRGRS